MELKSWREIAVPHDDVLKGAFKQSEFAADLSMVASGRAEADYADAARFFDRTFITEGMKLLLHSVLSRLSGSKAGDPVIQLQTAFGGGKTHTLLAVYHLARCKLPPGELRGIPPILDELGVTELPHARVVVIDGNRHSPSQPERKKEGGGEGTVVHTMWGELAWQLGGNEAYALVADADRDGTSPGKRVLSQLLERFAPCVILMDEMVAFLRQFSPEKSYPGGTFDSNLSFIQALTEAIKSQSRAVLLASLPESDMEVGGAQGKRALTVLEKYFGRLQAIWKPVGVEESFEIVRRRLFNRIEQVAEMEAVCEAYADLYRKNPDSVPEECQRADYVRAMKAAYPFHPELFERLYEDWSSLDKFQRTRGVLQLMAKVIHRLWRDNSRDLMIQPGALPLRDSGVKNQVLYYLPQGWDPVIDKDIDGEGAESVRIDTKDPRLGKIQAARRVARTVFLGSAPGSRAQHGRGVRVERIVLGAAQPGESASTYVDALGRLVDNLQYLNLQANRYWFDTRANLRKEMEERRRRLSLQRDVAPAVRLELQKMLKRGFFDGVHVFTPSGDISDDEKLRLCVLPLEATYGAPHGGASLAEAEKILENRGELPRHNKNRLIFLAPDAQSKDRLVDAVKTHLAWRSIEEDARKRKLNLDLYQIEQVKESAARIGSSLRRMMEDCYNRLLVPCREASTGSVGELEWECFRLDSNATSMTQRAEDKLIREELVLNVGDGTILYEILDEWIFGQSGDAAAPVRAADVWEKTCQYLYLPRFQTRNIFAESIADGAEDENEPLFGYALAKTAPAATDDAATEYEGLVFGENPPPGETEKINIILSDTALILHPEKARAAMAAIQGLAESQASAADGIGESAPVEKDRQDKKTDEQSGAKPGVVDEKRSATRFYGTIRLEPAGGGIEANQIFNEIVSLLNKKPSAEIKIRLDIDAHDKDGFDDATIRALKTNCQQLEFDDFDFGD
jgi:predicted AAA+ superfamily ATPase